MSQFAFLQPEWPQVYAQAVKAESYARSDARAACVMARLSLEMIVTWVYDHDGKLRRPYDTNLAALIGEPSFKRLAGHISQKAYLIKNNGNKAAHGTGRIAEDKAVASVRELHHVAYWLVRNYSRSGPPTNVQFSTQDLPRLTAVTPQKLAVLQQAATKWEDSYKAKVEAENRAIQSEADAKEKDAEIAALHAQIAAIKAANTKTPDTHDFNEAQTRTDLIDLMLEEAGWDLTDARDREYEVAGMPSDSGVGFVDYVLWGQDGKPLALVEAKRTKTNPLTGKRQASLYADCLEAKFGRRPLIFYTNGFEHWFWDDVEYPARKISGFLKHDELQTIIQRRRTKRSLQSVTINSDITDRYYSERAIKRVCESFETDKQRKALLVMATGSGKTRMAIALSDVLMRGGWVKRVLFLADRTSLVKQAADAFKEHLPGSSPVNLLKNKDGVGRVYLSTYQTMMGLIDEAKGDDGKAKMFGAGHFDLIIVDEAHRSLYKKFGAIFEYFDSLLLGLTATPKEEIDKDTYRIFELERGVPTDAYDLETAVKDGHLVPPKAISVPLAFPTQGVRYDDLSDDEKEEWDLKEWGDDGPPPDEISAADVNKWLFNIDTVDKALKHLMTNGIRVNDGEDIGKTIIFAKNSAHANFIKDRYDVHYPHKHSEAEVIEHKVKYAQSLIEDFKVPANNPRIAISVDMLDTGIDVPDVVNLVFFKVVRSKTKFWQMIGRGTRLRPDIFGPGKDKAHFLVFDHCHNFEFFNENPDTIDSTPTRSLSQSLFLARVDILAHYEGNRSGDLHGGAQEPFEGPDGEKNERDVDLQSDLTDRLYTDVSEMPLENFIVRPHRQHIEKFSQRAAWNRLTLDDHHILREKLSDLPTQHNDGDIDAKRFDLLVLRAQLALLKDSMAIETYRHKITNIVSALEGVDVPMVKRELELIIEIQTDPYWEDITPEILEVARRKLRSLTRLVDKTARKRVYSDFEDVMGEAAEVEILQTEVGFDKARFTAKARHFLMAHKDHITVNKIHTQAALTPTDMEQLELLLIEQNLYAPEAAQLINDEGGLEVFVRSLIGLDRRAVKRAFAEFIRCSNFNANQIEFVDMIIDALSQNGRIDPARLYEQPFTRLNDQGLSGLFDTSEATELVRILSNLNRSSAA